MAFSYPAPPDIEDCYWDDGERTAQALLLLEYPEGVPPAERIDRQPARFTRPFAEFPHDYAAVRVVAAKVLAATKESQSEAAQRYALAAAHPPGARVDQALSDEIWHWMQGLEPVLALSWVSLMEECANVSLGLESEAAHLLPADLVAHCTTQHRLAATYIHKGIPSASAPCPNHMFGPPSYVQGHVEEYLKDWGLLLELSSRRPIGHEFGEGVLQFMIRPADLREGQFDQVKLIASAY